MDSLKNLPDFDGMDELFKLVLKEFRLDPYGTHGIPHWRRVLRNGLAICAANPQCDPYVVKLFALLHDSCRHNEYDDIEHGLRATQFLSWLRDHHPELVPLTNEQAITLSAAILDHSRGFVCENPTINACWDADRLDLPRVGIRPDPEYLWSDYAKNPDTIDACWEEAWDFA
jgi:uncharacterized protein